MKRKSARSEKYRSEGWILGALWLAVFGLTLFVIGISIDRYCFWNLQIGAIISNVGALIFFVGVLQWLFDKFQRQQFFEEIRENMIESKSVLDSGISEFFRDSKDVNFEDVFLTSSDVVIGVNYSPKLIDNCISLIEKRLKGNKSTNIIHVKPQTEAAKFLEKDIPNSNIEQNIRKIYDYFSEYDDEMKKFVKISEINTVLRYSFVRFDSRIWIVVGTNGKGRRPVPGFMVKAESDWFVHFDDDIKRVIGESECAKLE